MARVLRLSDPAAMEGSRLSPQRRAALRSLAGLALVMLVLGLARGVPTTRADGNPEVSVSAGAPSIQCGTAEELHGRVSEAPQQIEDCFSQAYQQCAPATLGAILLTGLDQGTKHTFVVQSNGDTCAAVDTFQRYIAPPGSEMTVACADVTETDSGLLFVSCGSEVDVLIPSR